MADEVTEAASAGTEEAPAPAGGMAALRARRESAKKGGVAKEGKAKVGESSSRTPGVVHRQAPKPLHPKPAPVASAAAETQPGERSVGGERSADIPSQAAVADPTEGGSSSITEGGTSAVEAATTSVEPSQDEAAGGSPSGAGAEAAGAGGRVVESSSASVGADDEQPDNAAEGVSAGRDDEVGRGQRNSAASTSAGELVASGKAPLASASDDAASAWDRYVAPPVQDLARAEEVLNQRYINRESLNASVPVDLDIPHRIEFFKVMSGINQLPQADLVAVALDWFLRGAESSPDAMLPPWNGYVGPGTPQDVPRAEEVLKQRFFKREGLKWQTPEELKLNQRLAMYRVMNRLNRVPAADIVTVGLDRWLRVMGF